MTGLVELDGDQLTVHHAIIDLYEVYDDPAVTPSDIADYTGLSLHRIRQAMDDLEDAGIIECTGNIVTSAQNNGYYPIGEEE